VALLALVGGAAAADGLHRPSPDWRDQVLYFALTDRFDNGDPGNDDQGAGEFDPARPDRYSGGDLAGALRRLDYLQGLGVTGLWLTPWVSNQWLDGAYAGYHGYWASDFARVDPHAGTLADLQRLSRGLHARGMVLVQDIVVNHVGNYFQHGADWDPADPGLSWHANAASRPTPAPAQPPFHLNDPRRAADRAAAVYHWTPPVADYGDPQQVLDFQMSGLDDLNTENPVVRRALRQSYGHWIREAGVDAFRVDTAFYVPPAFFTDFLHAADAEAPGIAEVARATGRQDFLVFGEGFAIDRAFDDSQARRIEAYMTGPDGRRVLPGMLNFPLYGALGDVFARGRPPAELGWRITRMVALHRALHRMPSFVDNHDVDRFLASGSEDALRQALLAMFTLPGIPVIYQGTEQQFRQPRASMFAAGWGSGGRDHFDTGSAGYRAIAALAALRRDHRVFSRGTPTVLHADTAGAGAIAWRMDAPEGSALVAINTADRETLVEALALPAGTRLHPLWAGGSPAPVLAVPADGRLGLRLPSGAAWVWALTPGPPQAETRAAAPTLEPLPADSVDGDFEVRGRAMPGQTLRLVVDGCLADAHELVAGPDGGFQATVDVAAMVDPAMAHRVAVFDPASGRASAPAPFRVERTWQLRADVEDPAGDDRGPDGRTRYPLDPSWGDHRQLDLKRVRAWTAGGALRLDLAMHRLTRSWNPANGFDHVAFTIFIELPGEPGGARVMPGQDGTLPADLRWHRRLRLHGWSNAMFSADGATATNEGQAATPAPGLQVDAATHTLQLTLPPAALGHRSDLGGLRLWVTTWDWDGGYRALQAEPGGHHFGGTPGGARVMDSSAVITLR
jgi:glycosidase